MTDSAAAAHEAAVTRWARVSAVPVWVGAAIAAVLIALLARDQYLVWLPISMAAAVIVSFAIQLGIQRKEGYVARVMVSVGGAVVILALATGVLALLTFAR
jgi:hypothetical protein